MENDTRVAVDIAKAVFEIAVSDRPGRVARRERLPRDRSSSTFFAQLPAGHRGHGGLRLGPLLGAPDRGARATWSSCCRRTTSGPTSGGTRPTAPTSTGCWRPSATSRSDPSPSRPSTQQVLAHAASAALGLAGGARPRALNTLRGLLRELGFFIPEGRTHVLPDAWEIIQDRRPRPARRAQAQSSLRLSGDPSRSRPHRGGRGQLEALAQQLPVVARLLTSRASACSPPPPCTPSSATSALPLRPPHGELPRA